MCNLICPRCLLSNTIDCREAECPGLPGFVPKVWQRPILTVGQDIERYELLLLKADEYFAAPHLASNIALIIGREAQVIRAKRKQKAGRLLDGELHNEFPKLEGGDR